MALATRCPACNTIFRISTAQAAAKGGMVRCGQCRNVFNSLDALVRVEDLEVIDEVSVGPAQETSNGAMPSLEANPSVGEDAPIAEGSSSSVEQVVERAVISEWWLPERRDAPADDIVPVMDAGAAAPFGPREDVGQLLAGRRTEPPRSSAGLDGTNPTFMRPDVDPLPGRHVGRWLYGLLAVIAAIALLAQGAYLARDELAVRWSPAKRWLVAACVTLRCRVDYPAHLDAITIESASIQASGPNLNVYVLTALLRNRDAVDVRYPYLELVLTDLQDRPVLRRMLRPEDYLPARDGGRARPAGFAAESELPIRVMFELDDLRFAGYRLERFYP